MAESIIFTLLLGGKDQILEKLTDPKVKDQLTIIPLQTNKDTKISDKDRIFAEILYKAFKQKKDPILSIQLDNNNVLPIFNKNDVGKLQALNIKSTITFDHYNSLVENTELAKFWKDILPKFDHVFFVNEQDKELAIKKGIVSKEKTSTIKDMSVDSVIDIFNNIADDQKANTLISSAIPNKEKLDTIVQKTKNQNGRVVIKTWPLSLDEATNLITAKFGITSEDQIYGLKLEINEILKDQNSAAQNLQKYVSQISQQFQKDLGESEVNPIDFNFDKEKAIKDIPDKKPIIPYDAKQPEQSSFFTRVFNYFKSVTTSYLDKKEETQNLSVIPTKQEAIPLTSKKQQAINNTEFLIELNASHIEDIKKPDHLYEDYQIQHILKASIDESKVSIQPAVTLTPNSENILTNAINDIKTGKEASVIPIETGGAHWVGMSVSYNKKDDILIFTYNDPTGNPIDYRPELQKLINKAAPNNIVIDLKVKQQENEYDCGVFVCNNLIKLAKGQEILSTEQSKGKKGMQLRKEHAQILSDVMIKQQAQGIGQQIQNKVPGNEFQNIIENRRRSNESLQR